MQGEYHSLTRIMGRPDAHWLAHDGHHQWGPYTTEQMIHMLGTGQIGWLWNVWRDGMEKWFPVSQLFTHPTLGSGPIRLKQHGYYEVPKPPRKRKGSK